MPLRRRLAQELYRMMLLGTGDELASFKDATDDPDQAAQHQIRWHKFLSAGTHPAFIRGTTSHLTSGQTDRAIGTTAKLDADHQSTSTRHQRVVERMVEVFGRPGFLGLLMIVVLCWAGVIL